MATRILASLSFCHLLNDMMQSLLPAIYPILKQNFGLSFSQIGVITLVNQMTASLLQPIIGFYTDRRPQPYSLALGMAFTLSGMVLLAFGVTFGLIVLASALIGLGIRGLSPRIVATGTARVRRPSRLRAGVLPGWRKRGIGVRPTARGILRRAARPAQPGVVLADGLARHPASLNVGNWYKDHGVAMTLRARRANNRAAPDRPAGLDSRWRCCSDCCSRSTSISQASAATTPSI